MINKQLVNPQSIVIVGGSNDIKKPGGKIVKNIIDGGFTGQLSVINPKEKEVQGLKSFASVKDISKTDLAILAIPAKYCLDAVKQLAKEKETKAFIIISAGFSEANEDGQNLEIAIAKIVDSVDGCLIGPNCIGVINQNYKGVFTMPIPKFEPHGCDLISSSGATAVFIMEAGISLGVKFANVYSVGNCAQIAVEDVLEYMDINYNSDTDAPIKLLYLESINNPQKLLKHATSLINKGVRIAAIKAGSTAVGSRAASSHTGAIASSDITVRALFKKAGIVYCSSREELLCVASIFNYKEVKGKNIAIITHAGGSAVMLADELSKSGLKVPKIEGKDADKLATYLYPGSSVSNPIDFLATGTAEQLGIIIDYCEHKFDFIDAMVVVFGSPGLFDVENVYNVLSVKLDICNKPIFPVLPSVVNARKEIQTFLDKGNVNFPEEVLLGKALGAVYKTPKPTELKIKLPEVNNDVIRNIIESSENGYLNPETAFSLLEVAGISVVKEVVTSSLEDMILKIENFKYPLVMKVVGPLHKSDVHGVLLNVRSKDEVRSNFDKLMAIEGATDVMVQEMLSGLELFIGVKKEPHFKHTILCGLGGVYIEVLKDVAAGLSPISKIEAQNMVGSLKGYKIIKGARGQEGVNESTFVEVIQRLSALVEIAPEIIEMDINPLIGTQKHITAVDARIRIEK